MELIVKEAGGQREERGARLTDERESGQVKGALKTKKEAQATESGAGQPGARDSRLDAGKGVRPCSR